MRMTHTTGPVWLLLACLLPASVLAEEENAPATFEGVYEARYGSLRAEAERNLRYDDAQAQYTMESVIGLSLLGANVASITERSTFTWSPEAGVEPLSYDYIHKGIGARNRGARFDLEQDRATFHVDEDTGELPLDGPVFDPLNAYLKVQYALAAGTTDIKLQVLDRDEIELFHFRVIDEETLDTRLGPYTTLHLERVRDAGSKRQTDIWVAPALAFMLVKLVQEEPNGRTISLDLKQATLNGQPVTGTVGAE